MRKLQAQLRNLMNQAGVPVRTSAMDPARGLGFRGDARHGSNHQKSQTCWWVKLGSGMS